MKKMNNLLVTLMIIAGIAICSHPALAKNVSNKTYPTSDENATNNTYAVTIGINKFAEHPLLNDVEKGIIDELEATGFNKANGTVLSVKNANGDQTTAIQINMQFIDQNVDVLIPLATPAAQSAVNLTKTIPIVFGAITDPVQAQIADSLATPGGNKTGTSDLWPYAKQVQLIRQILPKAKTVGIIFNPGESNTQASLKHIRPALKENHFDTVEVPVSTTAEVYGAAKSLVGRCDAILIPADNTLVSAFESVVKIANENKIPLFAGSIQDVEKGAIATYGLNYYNIGRATGRLVVKILTEHVEPGTIPVTLETDADLVINLKAAKAQGVTVPELIRSQASRIIE
jgi:putative ABC transport system substrate-binding protein